MMSASVIVVSEKLDVCCLFDEKEILIKSQVLTFASQKQVFMGLFVNVYYANYKSTMANIPKVCLF